MAGLAAFLGWLVLCLGAGLLQALALTPPWRAGAMPVAAAQVLGMVLLVWALARAARARDAAWRGWVFGTAWLAGTFWWLVVSMHTYGGLPKALAVVAMLALAGFLALYTALAAAAWHRWSAAGRSGAAAVLLWTGLSLLAELLRGTWFTGFPWGAVGYAHGQHWAGWAPWLGVYGVGALAAAVAALLGMALAHASDRRWRPALGFALCGGVLALGLTVLSAPMHRWALSDTRSTGTLRVRLLQGNIAQDEKFNPGTGLMQALWWYPQQAQSAMALPAAQRPDLVVAPETALPLLPQQIGDNAWQGLLQAVAESRIGVEAADGGTALLLGLPLGNLETGYTNSAWGLTPAVAEEALQAAAASTPVAALAQAPLYRYDKHHLVPFGEFIPPFFRWFTEMMNIPLGDFNRGALAQAPWGWRGQRIAANICYEDLFGEELAAGFRDPGRAPTVLVNLSNIAWFGNTVAIDQHLQISRWRALELGRPMVRATNTGATAVIDHQGQVTAMLPRHTRDVLDATVEGRKGLTPYARWAARWGLWPLWGLALGLLWLGWRWGRSVRSRP